MIVTQQSEVSSKMYVYVYTRGWVGVWGCGGVGVWGCGGVGVWGCGGVGVWVCGVCGGGAGGAFVGVCVFVCFESYPFLQLGSKVRRMEGHHFWAVAVASLARASIVSLGTGQGTFPSKDKDIPSRTKTWALPCLILALAYWAHR